MFFTKIHCALNGKITKAKTQSSVQAKQTPNNSAHNMLVSSSIITIHQQNEKHTDITLKSHERNSMIYKCTDEWCEDVLKKNMFSYIKMYWWITCEDVLHKNSMTYWWMMTDVPHRNSMIYRCTGEWLMWRCTSDTWSKPKANTDHCCCSWYNKNSSVQYRVTSIFKVKKKKISALLS